MAAFNSFYNLVFSSAERVVSVNLICKYAILSSIALSSFAASSSFAFKAFASYSFLVASLIA
jgi:hypothetical protein